MKALVAVKRVVDYSVKIRVKADKTAVETENVKMSMNPFDEIAVEAAVRLKEAGQISEVVAVSVGSASVQETLRHALALGADRALHIEAEESLLPLSVAKLLHAVIQREAPQLVILGKQSIDGDNNQTGQMLAALWNRPQGTFASDLILTEDAVEVTREIDGGLETLRLQLPAVITTDLRLNEPRYASLPNIMKARKKPIESYTLAELGIEPATDVQILEVSPPAVRTGGIKVADVDELLHKLRHEAKVI